jgi:hypothetical protein
VLGTDNAANAAPIAGKHVVDGDSLHFTPLFPLDPGRQYQARYEGAEFLSGESTQLVEAFVALPAAAAAEPVYVTGIFPSSDRVPENQLASTSTSPVRMGRRGGLEHVSLLDDRGKTVVDPFLPADGELWNADRTRYTVFFDPGRQKRGILPDREMGLSLAAGHMYTLLIDREWVDGHGNPLRESYRKSFLVSASDLAPLDPKAWKISPPHEGTRDPVSVTFPEPLDHGLLMRAVGIRRNDAPVVGDVRVDSNETRWNMTPNEPWRSGDYALIALGVLEDLAGNRIGRPFEVVSKDDKGEDVRRSTRCRFRCSRRRADRRRENLGQDPSLEVRHLKVEQPGNRRRQIQIRHRVQLHAALDAASGCDEQRLQIGIARKIAV